MAIPLDTLARLEEFPVSQVEMSGNEWVNAAIAARSCR